jgi:hypothetical protein
MVTKYGVLDSRQVDAYLAKLIGRVFKIIPMNEEGCKTLDLYIDSLVREILGNSQIFLGDELFAICGTLKGLNINNHKQLKSDIFKTIDLIDRVRKRVK